MLSDKNKYLKIVIALILLLMIVTYAVIRGPLIYPGYKEAINNQNTHIGQKINFGGKILNIEEDKFTVEIDKKPVFVEGNIGKNTINYKISGTAIFNKDKSLKMLTYHTSNLRQYKVLISLIPLIVIIYLFLKQYTFDFKTFIFKRRNII